MINASDLPKQYRYKYRLAPKFGRWVHYYELIGQHGAVQLHITEYNSDSQNIAGSYGGSIEFHYWTPYQNEPPTQDEYWLLKVPCRSDISSLWASEYWIPLWENSGGDHSQVFLALARAADEKFAEHLGDNPEKD